MSIRRYEEPQTLVSRNVTQAAHTTGDFSRRTVLTGAAVATAAATIASTNPSEVALGANASVREDMILFVLLSAALTGITEGKLAGLNRRRGSSVDLQNLKLSEFPELTFSADPVDIKRDYFNWVNDRHSALFERLLRLTGDNLNSPGRSRQQAIIDKVQASDDTKFLARSIVLMWYLGAWYDPADLRKASTAANPDFVPHKIISAKAYTKGWVWQVAQAHPMGFSEMQFGYWGQAPKLKLEDFIG